MHPIEMSTRIHFPLEFSISFKTNLPIYYMVSSAVEGKTGKTEVLPGFCKIDRSGGSGCPLLYYGDITWPVRACHASGTAGLNNMTGKPLLYTLVQ